MRIREQLADPLAELAQVVRLELPELAEAAFMDPSLRTNPRMPLVAELVDLLRAGWTGR